MMQRSGDGRPNPKYAITFGVLSLMVLLMPVFWSPLNDQKISFPEQRSTLNVTQVLSHASVQPGFVGPMQPAEAVAEPASTDSEPLHLRSAERGAYRPAFDFSVYVRRMVFSLLGITLLIGLTLKALQKHLPGLAGKPKNAWMNVLAREGISPTQSIALIQVGPRILLVGLSEHNMSTLCELSQSEVSEMLAPPPLPDNASPTEQPVPPKNVYADILRHYLSIVPGLGVKK